MRRSLRDWIKAGESAPARLLRGTVLGVRGMGLPGGRYLGAVLWTARSVVRTSWLWAKKFVYSEPLVRYRCDVEGRLFLEGEPPLIAGSGRIRLGDRVSLGRRLGFIVGAQTGKMAELTLGAGTHIGFEVVISAERQVVIGSGCLIAGRVKIFDNNNHPVHPDRRHDPIRLQDCEPVILEDRVWVGQDATVLKGVRIGYGSVVAANAVVTHDVPPMSVVAGNPARIVKTILGDGR